MAEEDEAPIDLDALRARIEASTARAAARLRAIVADESVGISTRKQAQRVLNSWDSRKEPKKARTAQNRGKQRKTEELDKLTGGSTDIDNIDTQSYSPK